MTQYNVDHQIQGVNGFGLPFCNQIYTVTLTASTDTTVAVPLKASLGVPSATDSTANKYVAVFSYSPSASVYVAVNTTAAIPAGANFAASSSELNPAAKYVKATDTIHVISGSAADVSIAFYTIQS